MLKNRTSPTYCTLIIDDSVVERGYWDGRYDRRVCFDTDAEALAQSHKNPSVPVTNRNNGLIKPNGDSSTMQQSCANMDRGTGYSGILYAGAYADVCANFLEAYIGGMGNVYSVWLENPVADSICPQIYIRENYFPPQYTYVGYSSAFLNFIYVAWYRWSPRTC